MRKPNVSFENNLHVKIGTAIKVVWALIIILAGIFTWAGTIQARVEKIEFDQTSSLQKLDLIQKDTQHIKGMIDAKWGEYK